MSMFMYDYMKVQTFSLNLILFMRTRVPPPLHCTGLFDIFFFIDYILHYNRKRTNVQYLFAVSLYYTYVQMYWTEINSYPFTAEQMRYFLALIRTIHSLLHLV